MFPISNLNPSRIVESMEVVPRRKPVTLEVTRPTPEEQCLGPATFKIKSR